MHHVFIRGVARSVIAVDEEDFERGLSLLERTVAKFELVCHAWCYLPNHAHLLVTSRLGNLSRAMHWLGTCTAQSFNKRHERVGHLYQGRFGSRVIESDDYFLELSRYVPLNPVRAGLTEAAEDWIWSSYPATIDRSTAPWFLDPQAFLDLFGSREAYASWVADGILASRLDERGVPLPEPKPPLSELLAVTTDSAIATAHFRHGHTLAAIARHLGVSRSQIRRALLPDS